MIREKMLFKLFLNYQFKEQNLIFVDLIKKKRYQANDCNLKVALKWD